VARALRLIDEGGLDRDGVDALAAGSASGRGIWVGCSSTPGRRRSRSRRPRLHLAVKLLDETTSR